MQSEQTLVEIAYSFLCKKEKSSFNEIWTHVKKQCNISKENEEKFAGELYTGIILNANFFLKNDKFWYKRSEVSLEEIKEQLTRIEISSNREEE
ncbi:DNA-directed RNA polymerase subunit delta [Spiroplasma endosymbiont of Melieria omissa]|uniref:DNA-directed RNA polymerase subunit delta n=1 Tax=Spiroplasma endosymbiont of Melieria omissa TaxID=3139324 RepID=UPI003CCAAC09